MTRTIFWSLALALGAASAGCTALNDFGGFTFEEDPDAAPPDGGPTCPSGQTSCGGECVDTQTDAEHCGACDTECASGEACMAGSCMPTCAGGLVDCGGECVDVMTDASHCGGCDEACDTGEVCTDGECEPQCESGLTACGDSCVDTTTDAAHCGGCDMACPTGDECIDSACLPTVRDWRFTPCGATGAAGPTEAMCTSAYADGSLAGAVTVAGGIQAWEVPFSGLYRIVAAGAQGVSAQTGRVGGPGAQIEGEFPLVAGDTLQILVGQEGTRDVDGCNGGGGGGTFVSLADGSFLVVAGGVGGTRTEVMQDGCGGRADIQGGTGSGILETHAMCPARVHSARLGGAASSGTWGSGGGGADTAGASDCDGTGGAGFAMGGAGGTGPSVGGFGGGGSGNGCCGGGGGGGYSGGEGGRIAGGGGSFNAGASQTNSAAVNAGPGFVEIMLVSRCMPGECAFTCDAALTTCDGRCLDTQNDPRACSDCTTACASGDLCIAGGCVASVAAFTFPSTASTLDTTFGSAPLGPGGGGVAFTVGSNVRETFTYTGATSVRSLEYAFDMDDQTQNGPCTVGTLTFDIRVNGTVVGSYSYVGGSRRGRIPFSGTLTFPAVAGTGPSGDQYEISYRATNSVCPGGAAYNWFAGGSLRLQL